jgi:hypothetical protein
LKIQSGLWTFKHRLQQDEDVNRASPKQHTREKHGTEFVTVPMPHWHTLRFLAAFPTLHASFHYLSHNTPTILFSSARFNICTPLQFLVL